MLNALKNLVEKSQEVADKAHTALDPAYEELKKGLKATFEGQKFASLIATVASVAFGILGILLCVSGGPKLLLAIPLVFVSLAAFYMSYNVYKMSDNLLDFASNPRKYMTWGGWGVNLDTQKLKTQALTGTFGFDWGVDFYLKGFEEAIKAKLNEKKATA